MTTMSNELPRIAIIAEGPSDVIILEYILAGFFGNSDLDVNPLQPPRDKSGKFEQTGGWYQVLEYCKSSEFREAFDFNNYVIVQIDTDTSEDKHYDVPHTAAGRELTVEELIDAVQKKLIESIGLDFYERHRSRIIFAICVHSVECWLLPLYWTDNRSTKTKNCLMSLNERLTAQENFSIDKHAKQIRYYQKIARPYAKSKTLRQYSSNNPSLKIFMAELDRYFKA